MSFLGKARKEDLRLVAEELGEEVDADLKVFDLKELITKSENYEEEFVKGLLGTIIEIRLENESKKVSEEKERLELQREREVREYELERLRLGKNNPVVESKDVTEGRSYNCGIELSKLMPKFNVREDDIVLYLAIFERQVKRIQVDPKHWVSSLLCLLPSDIVQILARESEEKFEDYEYIKGILLRRFKLSPERFRKKFVQHQRNPERTWREFVFELNGFFREWIDGLKISDFNSLKDLIVTDQLKRRVPYEMRDHFVDDWPNITSPTELAEKLDLYESVREDCKKSVKESKFPEKKNHFSFNYKPSDKKNTGYISDRKNDSTAYKTRLSTPKFTCYSCGKEGHKAPFCPNKRNTQIAQKAQANSVQSTQKTKEDKSPILTAKVTIPVSTCVKKSETVDELKIVKIRCGNNNLNGIYDSGAQISVVRADLVEDLPSEGEGKIEIASAFGEREVVPLRIIQMRINDEVHGEVPVTCAVSKKLINDMLICPTAYEALNHNVVLYTQVRDISSKNSKTEYDPNVDNNNDGETERKLNFSSKEEEKENHKIISLDREEQDKDEHDENVMQTKKSFIELQKADDSLEKVWEMAQNNKNSYLIDDGILMHSENVCGEDVRQVVLPTCKRQHILSVAHEIPLAGHLGEQKTKQRIKYSFYWPNLKQDVKKFCESCKPCQLRRTVTYRDRVPIRPLVRPENPFEVWSVDCIGPLEPPSRRGHKYVICAIDLCTRWAEAVPVKNITAKTTCDVLMKIFTQTGFPTTLCTDQGSNFTSQLTKAFLTTVGVAPRFSTPGHPESMGAVERWNRTLKDMLNKNIQENGRNWDVHLPYLLFAYREVPHSTTGVSPFQLVYGRIPAGPLKLLQEFWTGKRKIPLAASPSVEQYMKELLEKLENAHKIASENADKNQIDYTSRYNLRSREKTFSVGDQVLILQPSSSHKLLNTWMGPATVIELTRPNSVVVKLDDGSTRNLHVNKIRPFVARIDHVGLIFEQDSDFGDLYYAPTEKYSNSETSYAPVIKKSIKDNNMRKVVIEGQKSLNHAQKEELILILEKYDDLFSKKPGLARVDGHRIRVTADCSPKRLSPYRVPISLQEEVDRQISELLEQGLIEPSSSDWAHPVVCVAKKDGTIRLCVDFRHLNSFTVSDAYPMKIAKDLIYEIGQANFITVLDLTKGYWQIPMEEDSKSFTAFVTHSGHYQWKVMPFGLKNAGSTFQKSMDKLFHKHKKYCRSYIDDVAIYSRTWEEHLDHIERIFQCVKEAGFTINLEKCNFSQKEVKFLGHIIGSGKHSPDPLKVETLRKLSKPSTKKELRSLIGLASYYRDYISNFSSLVLPLTNLTRKNVANVIPWNSDAEDAFKNLKEKLAKMSSMFTPNLDKPFQLYTDASASAVGACLAQKDDKLQERPIAFFSKKLTDTQMRWSTIEREAYGVIEALRKFDTWIFGAEIEVISDHNPLTYLTNCVPHGAKLARWSLALQRYNLTISYRKGSRHCNADSMSRLSFES